MSNSLYKYSDNESSDEELSSIFNSTNDTKQNNCIFCKCYSLPMFYDYDKYKHLENSDKILIPSIIMKNISNNISDFELPLLLSIEKIDDDGYNFLQDLGFKSNIITQVFECIEDIEDIYIPFRLMQKLWLNEGTKVKITHPLQKYSIGKKIIIKPHNSNSLFVDEQKQIIKQNLIDNYCILSKDDIISVLCFENTIYFDISNTFPDESVLVNEDLDIEYDDSIEVGSPIMNEHIKDDTQTKNVFVPFSGCGYKLNN